MKRNASVKMGQTVTMWMGVANAKENGRELTAIKVTTRILRQQFYVSHSPP